MEHLLKVVSMAFVLMMMVKISLLQSMVMILISIEFIMVNLLVIAILCSMALDMSMLILLFLCMMISEGIIGLCILVTCQKSGMNFIYKMNNLPS